MHYFPGSTYQQNKAGAERERELADGGLLTLDCVCLVAQLCPIICGPMDCSSSGFSVHGILQQECWNGLVFPSPEDLPDPGIKPRSPALQEDSLSSEPLGKPLHLQTLDCVTLD